MHIEEVELDPFRGVLRSSSEVDWRASIEATQDWLGTVLIPQALIDSASFSSKSAGATFHCATIEVITSNPLCISPSLNF